jgi:hypothetical protein
MLRIAEASPRQHAGVCAQAPANSLDLPVPPEMSLPITELQRRAEEFEYSELLDQVMRARPLGAVASTLK